MPEPSILRIKEIFWSFQGEGLRLGFPSIFLRLAGCEVRCPYCDSKESWGTDPCTFTTVTVPEILAAVNEYSGKYPGSQVVVTGGEPLEQDLTALVAALKKKDYFLSIETNGLHDQDLAIDWWTVSPKDMSGYFIHPGLPGKIKEIKLIVNEHLTLEVIRGIRQRVAGVPIVPIFLQPEGGNPDRYAQSFELFRRCLEQGIEGIRAGVQLHTVYGVQ